MSIYGIDDSVGVIGRVKPDVCVIGACGEHLVDVANDGFGFSLFEDHKGDFELVPRIEDYDRIRLQGIQRVEKTEGQEDKAKERGIGAGQPTEADEEDDDSGDKTSECNAEVAYRRRDVIDVERALMATKWDEAKDGVGNLDLQIAGREVYFALEIEREVGRHEFDALKRPALRGVGGMCGLSRRLLRIDGGPAAFTELVVVAELGAALLADGHDGFLSLRWLDSLITCLRWLWSLLKRSSCLCYRLVLLGESSDFLATLHLRRSEALRRIVDRTKPLDSFQSCR